MPFDTIAEAFEAGVDAYYAGEVPKGWDKKSRRMTDPFLMGWYLESQADNGLDLDLRG